MRCTGPWPMRWSRLRPAPISASWCCAPRARSSPPATIWASLPPSHATRDRRCARWSASCAIWLPPALRWSRRCRARRWGSVPPCCCIAIWWSWPMTPCVNLALVPEASSSLLMPLRIGHVRAFEMFALGDPVEARDALVWGLANRVVPRDQLHAEAHRLAARLAQRPAGAVAQAKQLMRDTDRILEQMERGSRIFSAQLRSAEAKEAFQAFAEKRQPDFSRL